ncbi:hypothetical protein EDD16DRAFT_1711585 [Pisolithus croceorrhizus]|nr:hypothetical protein EV401DRAFT_2077449 [Pisolithus croceorrhizus]KAI6109052.1 hypothetical protein EDD16DRAFT_1711585 [Pisolithus croceorrhizus]KAI6147554.1 hypothetical protein EDD17DRAFT_1787914 [Pisolithus thermaeus]
MNIKFNITEKDVGETFSCSVRIISAGGRHVVGLLSLAFVSEPPLLYSGANPSFTPDELAYQPQATQASVLVVHPDVLLVARSAVRIAKLSEDRIILFDTADMPPTQGVFPTVRGLIDRGSSALPSFREKRLSPSEGKKR